MAKKDDGPSTFPVTAPDGSTIHVPNLPRVGEPYHKPDPHASEARQQAVTKPSEHHAPAAPPPSHEFQDFANRVGAFASSAFKTLFKDDFDKVVSPTSSPLERIEGAASLGSWAIPEGKLAELAAHAAEKAAEFVASHAGEIQSAAAAIGAVVRPSSRSLTDAERNGEFKSFDEFKNFVGPARQPGGFDRDWHHIVEKNHADGTGQFSAEQVHSVHNIVPMEPFPHHRGKLGISHEFGVPDPDLGTSLRERLQGQPWERHVAEGERALVRHGFDPAAMRVETRDIFEQRLAQHDARFRSNGVTLEIGAGMAIGSCALHVSTDGRERTVQPGANFLGSIKSIDGDVVTQNLGRGQTAQWSLHELRSQFGDQASFEAAMKPGNMVNIVVGANGSVDAQVQAPGQPWQSLGGHSLQNWQALQSPGLSLGQSR